MTDKYIGVVAPDILSNGKQFVIILYELMYFSTELPTISAEFYAWQEIMDIVVSQQQRHVVVLLRKRNNLLEICKRIPIGNTLVSVWIDIVTKENNRVIPVLLYGVFPKRPSMYVGNQN